MAGPAGCWAVCWDLARLSGDWQGVMGAAGCCKERERSQLATPPQRQAQHMCRRARTWNSTTRSLSHAPGARYRHVGQVEGLSVGLSLDYTLSPGARCGAPEVMPDTIVASTCYRVHTWQPGSRTKHVRRHDGGDSDVRSPNRPGAHSARRLHAARPWMAGARSPVEQEPSSNPCSNLGPRLFSRAFKI